MPSSGTRRHSFVRAVFALAAGVASFAETRPAAAIPPENAAAAPLPVCAGTHAPTVNALRLDHDAGAAPRDGLLIRYERGVVPGTLAYGTRFPWDAGVAAISVHVEADGGELISGTLHPRDEGVAFRPARLLDAARRYTLRTRIDPNSDCFSGPVIDQSVEFVTETGLRESVPAQLEGVAYGRAWIHHRTYCCPSAPAHCDGGTSCLACWDYDEEPVIAFATKPDAGQEEHGSRITSLTITDADGTVFVNTPESWRPYSLAPFNPVRDSRLRWGPEPARICVKASTETVRTGAIAEAERCVDIDAAKVADGSALKGFGLPLDAQLAPPPDPAAVLLAEPCAAPMTGAVRDVVYAVRFSSSLPPGASFAFGEPPAVPPTFDAGPSDASADARTPGLPAFVEEDSGCSLASQHTRVGFEALLFALALGWR